MNFITILLVSSLIVEITIIIWSTVMGVTGKKDRWGGWEEEWCEAINWLITVPTVITVVVLVAILLPPCRGTCH